MKDTDIHNGLPDAIIRDFLSQQLVNIFDEEVKIQNEPCAQGKTPLETILNRHIHEANKHTKLAECVRNKMGIVALIKVKGWDEFDVSDQVIKADKSATLYRNFIGTEEEYNELFAE